MSDLNDIFGYQVYKPPLENIPVVPELNIYGEIVTVVDPNCDVINDPTIQALLESMDGERTVRVEELPPDMRYDGWHRKVEYDEDNIPRIKKEIHVIEPMVEQEMLAAHGYSKQFSINSARPEVEQELTKKRLEQDKKYAEFSVKQQEFERQRMAREQHQELTMQKQQDEQLRKYQQDMQKQQAEYQQQLMMQHMKRQQNVAIQRQREEEQNAETALYPLPEQVKTREEQQALIQHLLLELAKFNPQLALQQLQIFKPRPGYTLTPQETQYHLSNLQNHLLIHQQNQQAQTVYSNQQQDIYQQQQQALQQSKTLNRPQQSPELIRPEPVRQRQFEEPPRVIS